jgi:hypothetical protein
MIDRFLSVVYAEGTQFVEEEGILALFVRLETGRNRNGDGQGVRRFMS